MLHNTDQSEDGAGHEACLGHEVGSGRDRSYCERLFQCGVGIPRTQILSVRHMRGMSVLWTHSK